MTGRRRGILFGLAVLAALFGAGCTNPTVVRVVDGREVAGRFVSPRAYALYARGAEAEAEGELERARLEYLGALDADSQSPEIWARVGAVTCALGRVDEAREAFDKGLDVGGKEYASLYRERALCTLTRGVGQESKGEALADAKRALELDPMSEDAGLLLARAAEAAGDRPMAERVLRERLVLSPGRAVGWVALREFALKSGNRAAVERAETALGELSASPVGVTEGNGKVEPRKALAEVDAALAKEALEEARKAAKKAKLAPAELAVRAAAMGKVKLAKVQADLVFLADPTNVSAAIALASACDLEKDNAGVVRALGDVQGRTVAPSMLARLIFAEILVRRVDREAARVWLGSLPEVDTNDALLVATAARVSTLLK
ncbi:MAG: hypothetical protein IPK82_25565 [Polyangiaceae bacterium]|nr:hypothetical protein [Polyangiaceae bacterium]